MFVCASAVVVVVAAVVVVVVVNVLQRLVHVKAVPCTKVMPVHATIARVGERGEVKRFGE